MKVNVWKNISLAIFILISLHGISQKQKSGISEKKIVLSLRLLKCQFPPVDTVPGYLSLPDLSVCIKNQTDTFASFYDDWNLWGADAVSLEFIINDSVTLLYHGGGCWNKNFSSCVLLFPGDSLVFHYFLRQCTKEYPCNCFYSMPKGRIFPISNLKDIKVRAHYQVNLYNHKAEIERLIKAKDGAIDKIIEMRSAHYNRFKKLTFEQKIRSFVESELISDFETICFDTW